MIFKDIVIDKSGIAKKCLCCSYSQIEVFLQCAYRWYRDYLKGERSHVKQEALDLGSSVHLTMQEYCEAMKHEKKWELAEAIDLLDINMELQEIEFSSEESKTEAVDQHRTMIEGLVTGTSKLSVLLKNCEIVACEKDFQYKMDLPFYVKCGEEIYSSVYIIGSIDLILKDRDGDLIVIDYKSGKKVFDKAKLKNNLQLPIYSLVVQSIYGRLPTRTAYYFTRLDEIQEVSPLASSADVAIVQKYKNGKIKSIQRTAMDVKNTLLDIFTSMYKPQKYKAKPSPLCSWCTHGAYDKNDCPFKQLYYRKDIELPEGVY